MVFRNQHEFIDKGPESYLEWGRHFGRSVLLFFVRSIGQGLPLYHIACPSVATLTDSSSRLHIHPTSGHPKDYPQIHLVYK